MLNTVKHLSALWKENTDQDVIEGTWYESPYKRVFWSIYHYPKTQIDVCLHVIQSDGSEFAVGVNAATFALIDAGIPMKVQQSCVKHKPWRYWQTDLRYYDPTLPECCFYVGLAATTFGACESLGHQQSLYRVIGRQHLPQARFWHDPDMIK